MDYFNQVLFVEYDMDVNSIGVRQVRSMGYLVWPTYSVGEALECFTQHRDRIGILIADNKLPDGLGMILARDLLSRKPTMSAGIVSGMFTPEEIGFMDEERLSYFTKPVLYTQVIRTLGLPGLRRRPIGYQPDAPHGHKFLDRLAGMLWRHHDGHPDGHGSHDDRPAI